MLVVGGGGSGLGWVVGAWVGGFLYVHTCRNSTKWKEDYKMYTVKEEHQATMSAVLDS